MDLQWLGHACFRLHADDMVVITDPFPSSLGLRPDNRPATVITVSNSHPNHSNWEQVEGSPKVFDSPGEYEYSGINVRGVMTPLSEGAAQESRNVAYSIEIDHVNICHLGDLTEPLTSRQVQELLPVDVLLLPTGGRCTLDIDRLSQTMQDLDPKIVIPMHYSIPGVSVPLDGVEAFLRNMGANEVQPQNRLSVTTSNLGASLRVVVLSPQARTV